MTEKSKKEKNNESETSVDSSLDRISTSGHNQEEKVDEKIGNHSEEEKVESIGIVSEKEKVEKPKESLDKNSNNQSLPIVKKEGVSTKTSSNIKPPSKSGKGPMKINTGTLLEYRIQRLLFYMGYLSKVGIEITTSQEDDAEIITDLDVYGIYIHKDFRLKTVWADCKSGRAKPLERISWIKGIKELLDIDDVMFVKGGVKSTIKQFARKSDVQVLDLTLIERLEKDFSIPSDDWSGPWNPHLLENKLKDFSRITVPQNDKYKKIAKFISTDYWSTEKYTSLKKCITAFKELSVIPMEALNKEDRTTILWGVYQITTLFTLSLFKIIRELYYYSEHERRNALRDGMVSGEISIKKRQELISASYRLAFELIKSQHPDFQPPTKMINISPPSYFEALDDLLSRIIHDPLKYYDVARILDYSLFEFDLQDKEWDIEKLEENFNNIENNITGIKTILHFICYVTGIPISYYKIFS